MPNGNFTVAAAFGNVHGVYAPGNVSLKPVILHNTQKFIKDGQRSLQHFEMRRAVFVVPCGSTASESRNQMNHVSVSFLRPVPQKWSRRVDHEGRGQHVLNYTNGGLKKGAGSKSKKFILD